MEFGVDLEFGADGLLPVVAQDEATREVLMVAYADEKALSRTQETGLAHYYSRSRQTVWQKGEQSGHSQSVSEIRVDCDGDAVLYEVDQAGGACHTGYWSCFHRTLAGDIVGEMVFDPDSVYD